MIYLCSLCVQLSLSFTKIFLVRRPVGLCSTLTVCSFTPFTAHCLPLTIFAVASTAANWTSVLYSVSFFHRWSPLFLRARSLALVFPFCGILGSKARSHLFLAVSCGAISCKAVHCFLDVRVIHGAGSKFGVKYSIIFPSLSLSLSPFPVWYVIHAIHIAVT